MSAYWISTYTEVTDPDRVAAYARLAGPAVVEAGGRFVVRAEPAHWFESGRGLRVVVIEFDTVADAVAAYRSPAYQAALALLGDGAVRDVRIVSGG